MQLRSITRPVRKAFLRAPVVSILALLGAGYLATTLVIMIAEKESFVDAAMMCLPAFLGELGALDGNSPTVNTAILFSLLISIAFLAILTAKITSTFVEVCRQGGSIVKRVSFTDHIIICGWNTQGERIIQELRASKMQSCEEIVILASQERRPTADESVEFIRGDPSQDHDLIQAGIKRARSVIVLSDLAKPANEADAEALMIVLAVETLNRDVHTSVQILNAANRVHLERAHADEIICLDQMGGSLVVASATNHGISQVISELLTFNEGSEFYRVDAPLPPDVVDMEFSEAVKYFAERSVLLIAVETDQSEALRHQAPKAASRTSPDAQRVVVVNPRAQYRLRGDDALFVIAETKPDAI